MNPQVKSDGHYANREDVRIDDLVSVSGRTGVVTGIGGGRLGNKVTVRFGPLSGRHDYLEYYWNVLTFVRRG